MCLTLMTYVNFLEENPPEIHRKWWLWSRKGNARGLGFSAVGGIGLKRVAIGSCFQFNRENRGHH